MRFVCVILGLLVNCVRWYFALGMFVLCLFCRFGCCMLWYLRVLCNLVFMVFGCWLVVVTWLLVCGLRVWC